MDYRMKKNYLKNNFLGNNDENEKYLTEYLTRGVFHQWNEKLEVMTRIWKHGGKMSNMLT